MPSETGPGVILVISSLLCGGAERVAAGMADYWSRRGRPVHLVTLFTADLDFYPVPASVRRTDLGLRPDRLGPLAAVGALRRLRGVLRDDETPVVISYLTRTNILTLLAARGLGKRVIVTEHNHPTEYRVGRMTSCLRRMLYPKADALTVLTRDVDEAWAQPLMPEGRTAVLPNFVHLPGTDGEAAPAFELPPRFVVAAGRLVPQKGFDLLIEAYGEVYRRFPGVPLVILGEGPARAKLERLRAAQGLESAVIMPGTVRDVRPVFAAAELFVFSSRFEGFGNVLVEALACGTPAVSFDCPSGPSDILRHGVDGILVPPGDTRALAEAVCSILSDPARRAAMAEAALERARAFAREAVMPRWDDLVSRVDRIQTRR